MNFENIYKLIKTQIDNINTFLSWANCDKELIVTDVTSFDSDDHQIMISVVTKKLINLN